MREFSTSREFKYRGDEEEKKPKESREAIERSYTKSYMYVHKERTALTQAPVLRFAHAKVPSQTKPNLPGTVILAPG